MEYEIVNLEEKILVSLKPVRVKNSDPEISQKIGNVWREFSEKWEEIKDLVIG